MKGTRSLFIEWRAAKSPFGFHQSLVVLLSFSISSSSTVFLSENSDNLNYSFPNYDLSPKKCSRCANFGNSYLWRGTKMPTVEEGFGDMICGYFGWTKTSHCASANRHVCWYLFHLSPQSSYLQVIVSTSCDIKWIFSRVALQIATSTTMKKRKRKKKKEIRPNFQRGLLRIHVKWEGHVTCFSIRASRLQVQDDFRVHFWVRKMRLFFV